MTACVLIYETVFGVLKELVLLSWWKSLSRGGVVGLQTPGLGVLCKMPCFGGRTIANPRGNKHFSFVFAERRI